MGGEGPSKPSRRPVKWSVPKKRGLIPDGLVQARLSNFVVQFPNLGRVGSCNIIGAQKTFKTASFQLENLEYCNIFWGGGRLSKTMKLAAGQLNYQSINFYLKITRSVPYILLSLNLLNHSTVNKQSNKDAKEHLNIFCKDRAE